MITSQTLRRAARILRAGGVVAYPTEAVYGIGCDPWDPEAVARILRLKRRPTAKGLIVIAAEPAQLAGLVETSAAGWVQACASWPGFVTWVLAAARSAPPWLTADRGTLAVRITAHPVAASLCRAFGGPLVSSSANLSGRPPARSALAVRRAFPRGLDLVVPGQVGGEARPSPIIDGTTGKALRT